jgi:hypothetical protein
MPDNPEPDLILRGLVEDYLDAVSGLDKYRTMKDQLADQILARAKPGQKIEVQPGIGVRVQAPARRFDEAKAREVLSAAEFDAICVAKVSSQVASQVLPGALLDLCKTPGTKASVVVLG